LPTTATGFVTRRLRSRTKICHALRTLPHFKLRLKKH